MTLPTTGQIKASDIANEFGYSQGSTNGIKLGDYRGQDFTNPNNTSVRIPTSEDVPTSGPIKFSDFYGGRLTIVVNYFGAPAEYKPGDAYNRFTDPNLRAVVGNNDIGAFKQFNGNNSAGKKVVILVNEDIGSDKVANNSCALRTGTGWNADTAMQVLLGPDGEVLGAGGDGGEGKISSDGAAGGFGSSGLGIQFEGVGGTKVTIQSGGRIAGGGGGGGGGGSAEVRQNVTIGRGNKRYGVGGHGGGGAGLPAGTGATPQNNATKLNAGNATAGTNSNSNPGAIGGDGGIGGFPAQNGNAGGVGSVYGSEKEDPFVFAAGAGGAAGAAIRRIGGMNNIIIENLGASSQIVGSTVETGVT